MTEQDRLPWRKPLHPRPGPSPVRATAPGAASRSGGAEAGSDPGSDRTRQHLHRFFEELLRRSEH